MSEQSGGGVPGGFQPTEPAPREAGLTHEAALEKLRQARRTAAGNNGGADAPAGRAAEPGQQQPPREPPRDPSPMSHRAEPREQEQQQHSPNEPFGRGEGEGGEGGEGEGGAPPPVYDLVVNGKPQRVSLPELLAGYSRSADYTQKTQEIAAKQQEVVRTAGQLDEVRTKLEQQLQRFVAGAEDEFSAPIDWVKLAKEDPYGYPEKRARYDMLQEAKAEQNRLANLRTAEQQARTAEMLRLGHQYLSEVLPGWRDPTERAKIVAELRAYGLANGYTAEELDSQLDPRHTVTLRKAQMWDAMQGKKVQPRPQDPDRPARGGQAPRPQPGRRETEMRQNFDAAPTMRNAFDLAKALRAQRPPGRR
jgi:hypothetical protein